MKVSEDVFWHEVLDTTFLNFMINQKQNWDVCNHDVTPWTCGAYPADETPNENLTVVPSQISWISNTDPSSQPGKHWVSILRDVESIIVKENEIENCHKTTYYIIDSWGSKYSDKTCKTIIENLEDSYNVANHEHIAYMQNLNLRCKCKLEINLPIERRIQHATYENCGWYALRFCDMTKDELMKWSNSTLNTYGQIKTNYEQMVKYFTDVFFPTIVMSEHKEYSAFRCSVLSEKPSKCNQVCCCPKVSIPEYF